MVNQTPIRSISSLNLFSNIQLFSNETSPIKSLALKFGYFVIT